MNERERPENLETNGEVYDVFQEEEPAKTYSNPLSAVAVARAGFPATLKGKDDYTPDVLILPESIVAELRIAERLERSAEGHDDQAAADALEIAAEARQGAAVELFEASAVACGEGFHELSAQLLTYAKRAASSATATGGQHVGA